MARLGVEDDMPIEAGMVNKAVENAQTKVEGHNFDIRKHVLRYDEVVTALGGAGEVVERPEEIGPALDRAFAAGVPYMVNVLTDPANVYPRSSNLG